MGSLQNSITWGTQHPTYPYFDMFQIKIHSPIGSKMISLDKTSLLEQFPGKSVRICCSMYRIETKSSDYAYCQTNFEIVQVQICPSV